MESLDNLEELKKSDEFKDWKKSHKGSYLVHIFKMVDEANKDMWQFGFYNKKDDTITTFLLDSGQVEIAPDSKVFKEDKKIIKKLDLKKLKVSLQDSLEEALEFQKEKHANDSPVKTIMILQHLDLGQVWNVTFVTKTFKTLNVKVDSETGEIVKHSFNSIFNFKP